MARVYVDLIKKGRRTYEQVPDNIKPQVKQILIEQGYEDLIGE